MRTFACVCLAALVAAFSWPAGAAEQCGQTRAEIFAVLAGDFGEAPAFRGLNKNGHMVEVLTGPDGTWSVLVTIPGGCTYITSWGTAWQAVALEPAGDPS